MERLIKILEGLKGGTSSSVSKIIIPTDCEEVNDELTLIVDVENGRIVGGRRIYVQGFKLRETQENNGEDS